MLSAVYAADLGAQSSQSAPSPFDGDACVDDTCLFKFVAGSTCSEKVTAWVDGEMKEGCNFYNDYSKSFSCSDPYNPTPNSDALKELCYRKYPHLDPDEQIEDCSAICGQGAVTVPVGTANLPLNSSQVEQICDAEDGIQDEILDSASDGLCTEPVLFKLLNVAYNTAVMDNGRHAFDEIIQSQRGIMPEVQSLLANFQEKYIKITLEARDYGSEWVKVQQKALKNTMRSEVAVLPEVIRLRNAIQKISDERMAIENNMHNLSETLQRQFETCNRVVVEPKKRALCADNVEDICCSEVVGGICQRGGKTRGCCCFSFGASTPSGGCPLNKTDDIPDWYTPTYAPTTNYSTYSRTTYLGGPGRTLESVYEAMNLLPMVSGPEEDTSAPTTTSHPSSSPTSYPTKPTSPPTSATPTKPTTPPTFAIPTSSPTTIASEICANKFNESIPSADLLISECSKYCGDNIPLPLGTGNVPLDEEQRSGPDGICPEVVGNHSDCVQNSAIKGVFSAVYSAANYDDGHKNGNYFDDVVRASLQLNVEALSLNKKYANVFKAVSKSCVDQGREACTQITTNKRIRVKASGS
ncbi:hypothetical protein CYMTET_17828 [Cymbomonas tetramitiformis]|uniref:Uncharacterized protein n=1 Tax=Cymbomonas tetramitiformis TaxID=36881 RepID=A0AAE0L6W3_9CHLO|nr:hypothetical protein CYMTET_17828 [Cymbomonas tetramitiformis]